MGRAVVLLLGMAAIGALSAYGSLRLLRRQEAPVRPDLVDAVERLELELDLAHPPRLDGRARLHLRAGTAGTLWLLLNRDLEVRRAVDEEGRAIDWDVAARVDSAYHREARAYSFDLGPGARVLELDYGGTGEDGSRERDWMGVLRLAPDELRMSPQTVFYPQIPADLDGPSPTPWPLRLEARVPAGFEAYAPGAPVVDVEQDGVRRVAFEADAPVVPSFFAAPRTRRETVVGDTRVVTLLTPPHAALGEGIAREAEAMLRSYGERWGPVGARTLGIVEFRGRGSSYNWASQGIIAIESGALANGLATETLAHEVAHLWWGQEIGPRGRGERLLTEGLAEWASWHYLATVPDGPSLESAALAAREAWWARVHQTGVDPGVFDVRFGQEGYSELAYAKAPLALWGIEQALGGARMDAALRRYRGLARDAPRDGDSHALFLEALRAEPDFPELDLAAFETPGHLHLALADLELTAEHARGRLVAQACPKGLPAAAVRAIPVGVSTGGAPLGFALALEEGFEGASTDGVEGVAIDPRGIHTAVRGSSYPVPGRGFLSAEPANGAREVPLGPFTARLRFGVPLAAVAPRLARDVHEACSRAVDGTARFSVRAAALEEDGHVLALALADTEPAREHVLVVPAGLRTANGFPLPEVRLAFSLRDATGVPPPRIVRTEPAQGATVVATELTRIVVEFSEPMRIGRGFSGTAVRAMEATGRRYPDFGRGHWEDARTLVWELESLEPGVRYGIPFGGLYRSALGLALEPLELHFETAP